MPQSAQREIKTKSKLHQFLLRFQVKPLKAYGQSKTANILFPISLDEKGKDEGIRAFAVHPGGILDTELGQNMSANEPLIQNYLDADGKPILDPVNGLKTVEQGASTRSLVRLRARNSTDSAESLPKLMKLSEEKV